MNFQALFEHPDFSKKRKIVLFCNQASFDFSKKQYLFDLLADQHRLEKILLAEHGLFASIQDQENVSNMSYRGIPCVSLYDKVNKVTTPNGEVIEEADALVIDIPDVGVRFFTYTTHLFALLHLVATTRPGLPVFVIDRPNPIGGRVEGTLLDGQFASFLGPEGMIHRHGMSVGQLANWYLNRKKLELPIVKIAYTASEAYFIPPSPNLPASTSLLVYPGQCFWEATTFSEGRGTTRPFELAGHPDLPFEIAQLIARDFNQRFEKLAFVRCTAFQPTFHKHAFQNCVGWQLFIEDKEQYTTILGTLFIMREVLRRLPSFLFWRTGSYEFDSPLTAAELLIGDTTLIDYVNGTQSEAAVLTKLQEGEKQWRS